MDDIEEYVRQARGEKPIEADPTTGFHPGQLEAYPLQRVGPKLYTTRVEGLVPGVSGDILYVNAEEMEDYNRFGIEPEEMFDDVSVNYSVMNSKKPLRGSAMMKIDDFSGLGWMDDIERRGSDYDPNTVLIKEMPEEDVSSSIEDVRRKLDGEDVMIKVAPTA